MFHRFALAVMLVCVAAAAEPSVDAARFTGLVEGFDRVTVSPFSADMQCYGGERYAHPYARATFDHPRALEWVTAPVPADVGPRVTFAFACTLGGEGGTIVGVPFEISVNDKAVITVHSAAMRTAHWRDGDVEAVFVMMRPDEWGDPAGVMLLSLPRDAVTPGEPARISVIGKPQRDKAGSFFAVAPLSQVTTMIERQGGVATFVRFDPDKETVQSTGEAPRVDGKPLAALSGRRDDSICLTGNGHRAPVAGRYTYYDGRTDCYDFPIRTPHLPDTIEGNHDESLTRRNRMGGWVDFAEGKLTDGNLDTRISWSCYVIAENGRDVVIDLGDVYDIDEVVLHPISNHTRNVTVYLPVHDDAIKPAYTIEPDGRARWLPVQAYSDRAWNQLQHHPKLTGDFILPLGGARARYLRLNATWEAHWPGWKDIEIWGRAPGSDPPAAIQPLAQAGGVMKIKKPREIPSVLPDRALLPRPQKLQWADGAFNLTKQTVIAVPPGATARLARTAELLADDIADETGLRLRVVEHADTGDSAIVLAAADSALAQPQGYVMEVTPSRVHLRGHDEQGAFYATQTLMQLFAGQRSAPACRIVDWPDKPLRPFIASLPASTGFLKALARFRITHFMYPGAHLTESAIRFSPDAADRFVQFVPTVSMLYEGTPGRKEAWLEKAPHEKYEDVNPGRRNLCPSNDDAWAAQRTLIDRAAEAHGDYIYLNMDECYSYNSGARWNVCQRCRARNLSGHELMAETWARVLDYCKSKGKIAWSIDSPFFIPGLSHPDDTANDWRKTSGLLAERGYADDLMIMNWHTAATLDRFAAEGYQQTRWTFGALRGIPERDEMYLGYLLSMADVSFRPSQLLVLSQGSWSPGHVPPGGEACDLLVERWMPTFNKLWTGRQLPGARRDAVFHPIDLKPYANTPLVDEVAYDGKGFVDLGPNYDLRALKAGRRNFNGVPFDVLDKAVAVHNRFYFNRALPQRVRIEVNAEAASICFLHTLSDRISQAYHHKQEIAGFYHVYYTDHTFESVELVYGINIANFDGLHANFDYAPRGTTMARAALAWRGEMGCGNVASLYQTEWVNPYPDKQIRAIVFAATAGPAEGSPILLAATRVAPTSDDLRDPPAPRYAFNPRRGDFLLQDQTPRGRKIDLLPGELVGDDEWKSESGITINMQRPPIHRKSLVSTQPPWHTIESVLYEDARTSGLYWSYGSVYNVTFPEPRQVTGLRVNGMYRRTVGQRIDRDSPTNNFHITTFGGEGINQVVHRYMHVPDQEGPIFLKLDATHPINEIRIEMSCRREGILTRFGALELLEIYGP